jgi:hypothetical protein
MNIDTLVIEEEESRTAQEVEEDFQKFVAQLEARFVRVTDSQVLMALKKTILFMAQKEKDVTLALIDRPSLDVDTSQATEPAEPTGSD